MSTVFLSYNREDESAVSALAADIASLGHQAWFDSDLSGGQAWWDRILDRVRDSDVFVFALSRESLKSTACDSRVALRRDLGHTDSARPRGRWRHHQPVAAGAFEDS